MNRSSKTGALSPLQARKAVQSVKAKSESGSPKQSAARSARKVSPSVVERYLGHFGVVSAGSAVKRVGGSKGSAKKASAHKASRKAS